MVTAARRIGASCAALWFGIAARRWVEIGSPGAAPFEADVAGAVSCLVVLGGLLRLADFTPPKGEDMTNEHDEDEAFRVSLDALAPYLDAVDELVRASEELRRRLLAAEPAGGYFRPIAFALARGPQAMGQLAAGAIKFNKGGPRACFYARAAWPQVESELRQAVRDANEVWAACRQLDTIEVSMARLVLAMERSVVAVERESMECSCCEMMTPRASAIATKGRVGVCSKCAEDIGRDAWVRSFTVDDVKGGVS